MGNRRPDQGVSNCFTELFAYVCFLKTVCARKQPEFEDVKQRIAQLLEESARRMRAWGIDPRDFDDARFAVCAWVDETILNMPWSHRESWRRALLQTVHYGTTSAGEEFFERLNRLRSDETSVREVYFTCLSLGFRGRYHEDGDQFLLDNLRKSNLKSVLGATKEPAAFAAEALFPKARETALAAESRAPSGKFWTLPRILITALPPTLLVLLFAIYTFVLNGVLDNLLTHVGGGRG